MAKIYSYSILRSAAEAFVDRLPYCSAILELDDGSRVAALLDGYDDFDMDMVSEDDYE